MTALEREVKENPATIDMKIVEMLKSSKVGDLFVDTSDGTMMLYSGSNYWYYKFLDISDMRPTRYNAADLRFLKKVENIP